jgi:hypothetical protein
MAADNPKHMRFIFCHQALESVDIAAKHLVNDGIVAVGRGILSWPLKLSGNIRQNGFFQLWSHRGRLVGPWPIGRRLPIRKNQFLSAGDASCSCHWSIMGQPGRIRSFNGFGLSLWSCKARGKGF